MKAFAQTGPKYTSSTIRTVRISTTTSGLTKHRHEGTVARASTGEKELKLVLNSATSLIRKEARCFVRGFFINAVPKEGHSVLNKSIITYNELERMGENKRQCFMLLSQHLSEGAWPNNEKSQAD